MTKKIILFMICLVILVSCGRKADPEYKATHYNIIVQKV